MGVGRANRDLSKKGCEWSPVIELSEFTKLERSINPDPVYNRTPVSTRISQLSHSIFFLFKITYFGNMLNYFLSIIGCLLLVQVRTLIISVLSGRTLCLYTCMTQRFNLYHNLQKNAFYHNAT